MFLEYFRLWKVWQVYQPRQLHSWASHHGVEEAAWSPWCDKHDIGLPGLGRSHRSFCGQGCTTEVFRSGYHEHRWDKVKWLQQKVIFSVLGLPSPVLDLNDDYSATPGSVSIPVYKKIIGVGLLFKGKVMVTFPFSIVSPLLSVENICFAYWNKSASYKTLQYDV